jgi:protein-S-isoprenylcysteine O-methyltransferase Ste14
MLVVAGELVRLWSVRHIGVISRTRSERLGPLVATGPFAIVRNPLYLGNGALWVGFALLAGMPWMVPIVICTLALEYHAIVRWEEQMLEARWGEPYRRYLAKVPRWIPRPTLRKIDDRPVGSWKDTLFSERGTLLAIAAGTLLLWIKQKI